MDLLVVGDEAHASRLAPFFEDRGVRVQTATPNRLPEVTASPDAIVVCGRLAEDPQLVAGLRRRWPGVTLLAWSGEARRAGAAGDADGRASRRRSRAAAEAALHPGEIAFRLAQAVHGTAVGGGRATGGDRRDEERGGERDRVA